MVRTTMRFRLRAKLAVGTLLAALFAGLPPSIIQSHAYSTAPNIGVTDYATDFFSLNYGYGVGPVGLAFDAFGNLYVSNYADGSLYEFPPGGGSVYDASVKQGSGVGFRSTGLAFSLDKQHLYVGWQGNCCGQGEVDEVNIATLTKGRTIAQIAGATGLATDPLSGDLFVSGAGNIWRISQFASGPGTVTLYATVGADGIAFGADGTLYGAVQGTGIVSVPSTKVPATGAWPGTQVYNVLNSSGQPAPVDGIGVGAGSDPSHPPFLYVNRNDGIITKVDLTTTPPTATDIVTGGSRGDHVTVDANGCLFATQSLSVIKVTDATGACNPPLLVPGTTGITVPGRPQITSVVPGNGNAAVTWRPPSDGGSPITSYTVTSSPGNITRTVDGSTTSATFPDLAHDCQTWYSFTVTARNAIGIGPVSLPSEVVFTSGHPSSPPSRVVIFVGGIGSYMPQTVSYDPLTNVPTYCGLLHNQASINADLYTTASYFDPSHPAAYPDPSPNLTDVVAEQGAVILPFSYWGARFDNYLTQSDCQPVFQVNLYPSSAPGDLLPETAASKLNTEVQSIKCEWPNAGIVIVGHSNGGLVAETYWKDFLPKNPANVTAVFSIDGVINGVQNPVPLLDPSVLGGQLQSLQLSPWVVRRYFNIWQDRATRDTAIIQANAAGVFQPIGTHGDSVYQIPDCWLAGGVAAVAQVLNSPPGAFAPGCYEGLDSQLLYNSAPGPGQTGTLISPDFQTPQDATLADALRSKDIFVSHSLVMEHYAVIAKIGTAVLNASSTPTTALAVARLAGTTTTSTLVSAATVQSRTVAPRTARLVSQRFATTATTFSTTSTTATTSSSDPTSQVPCAVTNPPTSTCVFVLPDVVSAGQTIGLAGTGIGTSAGSVLFTSATGQVSGTVSNWQSPVGGVEVATVVVPATATTGPVSVVTADGQSVPAGGVTVLGTANQVTNLVVSANPASPVWGQFATVTVQAFNGKSPVAGATVVLSDDLSTRSAVTDSSGIARFQYTAFGTAFLVAVSGSTYARTAIPFQSPPAITMSIASSAPTGAPGQGITVSATLTNASGAPVANQSVSFRAFGVAPASLSAQQAVTNSSGVASITVSSSAAGTTSIVATANYDFAAQSVDLAWGP